MRSLFTLLGALSLNLLPSSRAQNTEITFTDSDIAAASSNIVTRPGGQRYACKSYPGDRAYPWTAAWASFNRTVGRNLQLAIPPGAVCYQTLDGTIQTFDAAKCAEVQTNWGDEQWKGFYGDYVVLAKTREHIKYTIDFARKNNLRLIIRNTGHDFMGRSTGWGSLILTHMRSRMCRLSRSIRARVRGGKEL
ncbi:hypothetical protein D9611_008428 [Ephemerocybe angulata]|uniref:Uncharacterized protein n=1 Tax=Ephemerocybe angulata TaxID=980116 RepID=A0A8H5BIK6_9AGAR|nr:hypothetical protein D9611_008428 [Tulosesus angulatus]